MLPLVAGFMVFISLDELLPVAQSYAQEHIAIAGVMAGMAVMALSLWMLINNVISAFYQTSFSKLSRTSSMGSPTTLV